MVRLALTQEDLAALCGTSRESANRALRALRDDGRVLVVGRGRFLIHPACRAGSGPAVSRRLGGRTPSCRITKLHVGQ